jgi:hypothetical protein
MLSTCPQERRFSTLPEEENTETVSELLSTFLENLKGEEDAQIIRNIYKSLENTLTKRTENLLLVENEIKGFYGLSRK